MNYDCSVHAIHLVLKELSIKVSKISIAREIAKIHNTTYGVEISNVTNVNPWLVYMYLKERTIAYRHKFKPNISLDRFIEKFKNNRCNAFIVIHRHALACKFEKGNMLLADRLSGGEFILWKEHPYINKYTTPNKLKVRELIKVT